MPFSIKAKAKEIFRAFGPRPESLLKPSLTTQPEIDNDIGRIDFLGTGEDRDKHRAIWLKHPKEAAVKSYSQGSMNAGMYYVALAGGSPLIKAFVNKEEHEEFIKRKGIEQTYSDFLKPLPGVIPVPDDISEVMISERLIRYTSISIAYIDEAGVSRGLAFYYRKDDPSKWVFCLTEDTHQPLEEAEATILTSFDPKPSLIDNAPVQPTSLAPSEVRDLLCKGVNSPELAKFIEQVIRDDGTIHPGADVIFLFIQRGSEFIDKELLEKLPQSLDSKILALLQAVGLKPSLKPVKDCLDPNSNLFKLMTAYMELKGLKTLDQIYDLETKSENQGERENHKNQLSRFLSLHTPGKDNFLAVCLSDPKKVIESLDFLSQTSMEMGDQFVRQLSQIQDENILDKLTILATKLKEIEDKTQRTFLHDVFCKVLLDSPDISKENLLALFKTLLSSPVLQKAFYDNPLELVGYITVNQQEKEYNECLKKVVNDFSDIVSSYEVTAGGKAVSQAVLSCLAKKYLTHANDPDYLKLLKTLGLHFYEKAEPIEAGCVLFDQGIEPSSYVLDPVLVYCINLLKSFGLEKNTKALLDPENSIVLLNKIYDLSPPIKQQASLILLTKGQLDEKRLGEFINACQQYPDLAKVIVKAYEEKFTVEELQTLAFDASKHQAAAVLMDYGISFSLKDLTPLTCQTVLALVELSKTPGYSQERQDYLKKELPNVLKADAKNKETASYNKSPNIAASDYLLQAQAWIKSLKLKPEQEEKALRKAKAVASELACAVRLLNYLGVKEPVYAELFKSFEGLFAGLSESSGLSLLGVERTTNKLLEDKRVIPNAIKALLACHEEKKSMTFAQLLWSPTLATAIAALATHGLEATKFLGSEEENDIIEVLNKLSQSAPMDKAKFELATSRNKEGQAFRDKILNKGSQQAQEQAPQPFFLIEGTLEEIITSFGKKEQILGKNTDLTVIEADINRIPFFGSPAEGKFLETTLLGIDKARRATYMQGEAWAGTARFSFGEIIPLPFLKNGEKKSDIFNIKLDAIGIIDTGFINKGNVCSGLQIYYRKDDPTKWLISYADHTNLSPDKQRVKMLASFDPRPAVTSLKCSITKVSNDQLGNNNLVNAIAAPELKKAICSVLDSEGKIVGTPEIINLFTQHFGAPLSENQSLLKAFNDNLPQILSNPVFSKLSWLFERFEKRASPEQLLRCFNERDDLYQLIDLYQFSGKDQEDANQLQVLLFLDAHGLNKIQAEIRKDQTLVKQLAEFISESKNHQLLVKLLKNQDRRKLLPFILRSPMESAEFQKIGSLLGSDGTLFWATLEILARKDSDFTKDLSTHQFIRQVLLDKPNTSAAVLEYFSEIIPSYPKDLLLSLVNRYIETGEKIDLEFLFQALTPLASQMLSAVDSLGLRPEEKAIQDYLQAELPKTLALCNSYHDSKGKEKIGALSEFPEKEATVKEFAVHTNPTLKNLDSFLEDQRRVITVAKWLGIPEEDLLQLMKDRKIAEELTRAVGLLDKAEEKNEKVYEEVFLVFETLPKGTQLNEEITTNAVSALLACCRSKSYQKLIFSKFLKDPELAKAIPAVVVHGLRVTEFLDSKNEEEIILALNKLSQLVDPRNRALAVQLNDEGQDFRRLLAWLPIDKMTKEEGASLVELLREAILKRGTESSREAILEDRTLSKKTQKLALHPLDGFLMLTNRLRNAKILNADEMLDFMMQNNETNQAFYNTVLNMEVESDSTMARLKSEHKEKYTALQDKELNYRRTLYEAMYMALKDAPKNKTDAENKIKTCSKAVDGAFKEVLEPLHIDKNPTLRFFAQVLFNFATLALSAITSVITGDAVFHLTHGLHREKTGDFFFHESTRSEETYKTMHRHAKEMVKYLVSSKLNTEGEAEREGEQDSDSSTPG